MNFGFVFSFTIHFVVLLTLSLELYHQPQPKQNDNTVVLGLITVEDVDNIQLSKHKAKLQDADKKTTQKFYKDRIVESSSNNQPPQNKTTDTKPEVPKVVKPKNTQKDTKSPTIAEVPQTVKPKTKPAAKTSTKVTSAKPVAANKQKVNDIDAFAKSVMASLDVNTSKQKQYKTSISDVLGHSRAKYTQNNSITISEITYIRQKISQHWNTSYFANLKHVDMGVELLVSLNQDGSVQNVKLTKSHGKAAKQYGMFVDSAESSVWNASPFDQLNVNNYDSWQEIIISFDPSGIIY